MIGAANTLAAINAEDTANVPSSALPAVSPVSAMAAPMAAAPTALMPPTAHQGPNIGAALKQLLPLLISGIVAKQGGARAGTAVLDGVAEGTAAREKQRAEQAHAEMLLGQNQDKLHIEAQKDQQDRAYKLSNFISEITKTAASIEDAASFAQTIDLADSTAQRVFGVPPGFIKEQLHFQGDAKAAKKDKAEAVAIMSDLEKRYGKDDPEWLPKLIDSGATIGGRPLSEIAALTNYEVRDGNGGLVTPKPGDSIITPTDEKSYVAAAIAEARTAARTAGKPFTQSDAIRVSGDATQKYARLKHVTSGGSGSGGGGGVLGGMSDSKEVAAGIADGTLPPTLATQGNSKERYAISAELRRKRVNLSGLISNWIGTQRAITSLNSSQQLRLVENIVKASESLDKVEELNKALTDAMPRGKYKTLNKLALAAAKSGAWGQPAAQAANLLEGQIADLTAEMANVYMGGNSPTDHGLELASKNLNSSWDQTTLTAAIQQARYNLNLAQGARNQLLESVGVQSTQFDNTGGRATGAGPGPAVPPPPATPPKNPKEGDTWNSPTGPTQYGKDAAGRLGWHPVIK